MRNISAKPASLRRASAEARLRMPQRCMQALRQKKLEKGDALEIARMAGILAAKKTWELLPLCHQLPLTHAEITYQFSATVVHVEARVETVAGTGVEMEALTAASIAALTLYDLLKPVAGTDLEILNTKLLEKTGGKSDFPQTLTPLARGLLLVTGRARAATAAAVRERLTALGIRVPRPAAVGIAALPARIRRAQQRGVEFVATVGGTGIARDDRVVAAVRPLLDKELPGVMEAARHHGQQRTPYALISGGIAGLIGQTLIVTLPGSGGGSRESLDAIGPGLVHVLDGLRR
jgi:cyclic pyranopterin monophosphate synthase